MRALTKTILFARATHDRKVYSHPVAVFGNERAARDFAVRLLNAHKSGDVTAIKALDESVALTDAGELIGDVKLSKVTVPYNPGTETSEVDPFA